MQQAGDLAQLERGVRLVHRRDRGVAPGEDPALAAERELIEETGYRGGKVTSLGSFVTNANQGCNTAHLFRIDGCRREREPDSGDLEEMELVQLTPVELLTSSRFDEMGTLSYVTLVLLAQHKPTQM